MRFARPAATPLLLLVMSLGCGGRARMHEAGPAGTATYGPHNGPALALPRDRGYAEVVAEVNRSGQDPSVVVYFLGPDLKQALSPLPSDVRVKLVVSGGGTEELPLSPTPKADDRGGAGRVASAPVPVDPDRVSGELTANVEGQRFTGAFAIGR